jgi:AcrR family transcriptional regulator
MSPTPQSPSRIGRPRSETAESHAAIMDAVYELLQEKSARDLTMEAVAKRAGVGKPTLYKWWPTKAALIFAMFHERMVGKMDAPLATSAEAVIRTKVRHLIGEFNGLFGKVMAELIAEGQNNPSVLHELYESHIGVRRESTIADIERGKSAGEFPDDTDPELLVDAIFGPMFYRLLLRLTPLTQQYGDRLIDQVLRGLRTNLVREFTPPSSGNG